MRKVFFVSLFLVVICCLLSIGIYYLPPVNERLAWRVDSFRAQIQYAIKPPEEAVFVPQATFLTEPSATPQPSPNPTQTHVESTPGPTLVPTSIPTPTASSTPLPSHALLKGIKHEYQKWNNCGPANLSMALSYWGWQGTQLDTAAFLKPNPRDKNVSPGEMATFIRENTPFGVMVRVGGDLDQLKKLVAAGFPVIVEKGFEGVRFDGWMGHYEVVNGYEDIGQRFLVQDSYEGPNRPVNYEELLRQWRAFNFLYIVPYPLEREADLISLIGAKETYEAGAQLSEAETLGLTGRDQFFAWYNLGTNRVALQDYPGAAQAYDQAFMLYPGILEKERPWRMLWYQAGPFAAYFMTGRFQDVVNLADQTLQAMSEPVLEEGFYWRGRAKVELGDLEGAVADFRTCLDAHPGYFPCGEQLSLLGAEP